MYKFYILYNKIKYKMSYITTLTSSTSSLTIIIDSIIDNIKVISYIPNDSKENINILLDDLEGNEVKKCSILKLSSKFTNKNLLEEYLKDLVIYCLQEYNRLTRDNNLSSNDLTNFLESFSIIIHSMIFKYEKIHLKGTLYLIEFIMKCLFFILNLKPENIYIFSQLISSSVKLSQYDFSKPKEERKCCCSIF